jgi:omega-6 fatty acid desaturase (delta-12 desaturase)
MRPTAATAKATNSPEPLNSRGHRASKITSEIKKPLVNDLSRANENDFIEEYEENYKPPSFSIKELKESIPPHLFERSLFTSSVYLTLNLLMCGGLLLGATYLDLLPPPLIHLAWPAYWWLQGIGGTGLWILAHECGHHAFSHYRRINHTLGLVLHSLLLVPYHPFRITHAVHHASTGNMEKDHFYVPERREKMSALHEALNSSPLYVLYNIGVYLFLGLPLYFCTHSKGQKYPRFTCSFLPSSPIFEPRHRSQVLVSDACLFAVVVFLGYTVHVTSFWTVVKYYGIPYLCVNAWIITITLLNHTDVYLPHYSPKEWNFVRGALATVDRDYGPFLNTAFHHIQDSHVVHHLFSQIPHYNAIRATPYLRKKLGEYYLYDRTPVWRALYRAVKNCVIVEDSGDVLFYRRK